MAKKFCILCFGPLMEEHLDGRRVPRQLAGHFSGGDVLVALNCKYKTPKMLLAGGVSLKEARAADIALLRAGLMGELHWFDDIAGTQPKFYRFMERRAQSRRSGVQNAAFTAEEIERRRAHAKRGRRKGEQSAPTES